MADVETRLASRYKWTKLILIAACLIFGVLAVYDGYFKYPGEAALFDQYTKVYLPLDEQRQANDPTDLLTPEEEQLWQELNAEFQDGTPTSRSSKDIWIQRWVFIPICFPLATLLLLLLGRSARRKYVLRDDGTLVTPEGTFSPRQMTGMDKTRWQSKSIAMLEIDGGATARAGRAIRLDAWVHEGLEEVIDRIDRRLHPEEYVEKAGSAGGGASVSAAVNSSDGEKEADEAADDSPSPLTEDQQRPPSSSASDTAKPDC